MFSRHPRHLTIAHWYLGVMVAGCTTFGQDVVRGVADYCARFNNNVNLDVKPTVGLGEARNLCRQITYWPVGAAIVEVWEQQQLEVLEKARGHVVEVGGIWRPSMIPQVIPDHRAAGALVAQHFLEHGLRSFGCNGMADAYSTQERLAGFNESLGKAGFEALTYDTPDLGRKRSVPDADRHFLAEWLASVPKPFGLLCSGDYRAAQTVFACRAAGLRIPEDIAIVGTGNDRLLCDYSGTPISSVDLHGERVGQLAAELIDRMRRGEPPPSEPILVPPAGLVTRYSSDVLLSDNAEVVEAIRYIDSHINQPFDVRSILDNVPISRRALEKHFRKLLGRTPHQQITHARVERAKRLLSETELRVSDVAEQCGFSCRSRFSVIFKRIVGAMPKAYRREHKTSRPSLLYPSPLAWR